MGNDSAGWDDLPSAVRDAIETRTGPVSGAEVSGEGNNSSLRLVIDTPGGRVFLKGVASGGPGGWKLDQAAALAPYVSEVSPERVVAVLPAWREADPRHVDVFARANVAMWDEVLAESPGWPRDWRAAKARAWADYRAASAPT